MTATSAADRRSMLGFRYPIGVAPTLPGVDWRLPENRREAFMRSYLHSLKYAAFPGCVYFMLPALAVKLGWDTEQRYWAAWLNANTQNPVTTYLLMEYGGSVPHDQASVADWQAANWHTLQWDTDRKYFKSERVFRKALAGYAELMDRAGSQSRYWAGIQDWDDAWQRMTALPYMGRLSAWSGLEYMRLLGDQPIPDADTLMLDDASGSRSHRNGLALLAGYDAHLHDAQLNPGYSQPWAPDLVQELGKLGESLLTEAQGRGESQSGSGITPSRLTLESALCTFKSNFKKNRRYPNVYSDMMHERVTWAEARHGQLGVFWDIREEALPAELRLEDVPTDPGVKPLKQNWFRETGELPILGHTWPDMWSGFDQGVKEGRFGIFR